MKAISLWQPWASLIAAGLKPYETRDWAPPRELIGQQIAIHAAKKVDPFGAEFATELMYGQCRGGFDWADKLEATMEGVDDRMMGRFGQTVMPIGCVVCLVTLEAAFQLGELAEGAVVPASLIVRRIAARPMLEYCVVPRDEFGNYAPGRWAWLLSKVQVLKPPVKMNGRQGFFDLPQGWLTAEPDEPRDVVRELF